MRSMAPHLIPRIIDGGRPNLDTLGITYVVLAIIYTIIVSLELCVLYRRRSAFSVRIRNVRVTFAAVSLLHIYLILVLLVYPWNGLFPCSAEFWIMALFLPSGMALFQACNARVLMTYESQRRLRRNFIEAARKERLRLTPRGLCRAWKRLGAIDKVYVATVIVFIVSVIPSTALFFGSRRFHTHWGSFGQVVDSVRCRRGMEWIPSILVQFFWIALVGPWILWKIRKVDDVHAWAWQTRLAIIAGLPGTPMWLAFTYSDVPAVLTINKYFPPAGWFLTSLLICQQVLLVIPLLSSSKRRTHSRHTSISSHSTISTTFETSTLHSTASTSTSYSKRSTRVILNKQELKPKASMQALEFNIEHSIEPLISWAANREFTAENTIFLREVRNWKKKWISAAVEAANENDPLKEKDMEGGCTPEDSARKGLSSAQRRQMFTEASLIFFTLVNPFTAETPINIEYKIFRNLQTIFSGVEWDPYLPTSETRNSGRRSSSTGSTADDKNAIMPQPPSPSAAAVPRDNVVCPWEEIFDRPTSIDSMGSGCSRVPTVSSAGEVGGVAHVPREFNEDVFDAAFESIKYLVFTNTWPRYVEAELAKEKGLESA